MNKLVWLLLCVTCVVPSATAQSNSLYRRKAPASQPAAEGGTATAQAKTDLVLPNDPAARPKPVDPAKPRPLNPTLLAYSAISVEMPEAKKFHVHDLVTVVVKEDRRQTTDAKMDSKKQWQLNSELAKWLRLDTRDHLVPQLFPNGTPGIDFNWDDQYKGSDKNERKDSLLTRITAEIIDIKPNSTLVLQATKRIKQDGDELQVSLTGSCRSEDVLADNTVLSTQLADLKIDSVSEGQARDATKRGWLKRALDTLNPM